MGAGKEARVIPQHASAGGFGSVPPVSTGLPQASLPTASLPSAPPRASPARGILIGLGLSLLLWCALIGGLYARL